MTVNSIMYMPIYKFSIQTPKCSDEGRLRILFVFHTFDILSKVSKIIGIANSTD
jgi:hypothetical protein